MDQLAHKAEDCVIITATIKTKSYFACACNIAETILVFSICVTPPSKRRSQNTLKTLVKSTVSASALFPTGKEGVNDNLVYLPCKSK